MIVITKSKQEIFDAAFEGVYRQGERSMDRTNSTCRYRGRNGTKCAIGYLIPDNMYQKTFEGMDIRTLIINDVLRFTDEDVTMEFLQELQYAHDCSSITKRNRESFVVLMEEVRWKNMDLSLDYMNSVIEEVEND